MIQKRFLVTVDIPKKIWDKFHETTDYNIRCSDAIRGHLEAGSDFYDQPYEWAMYDSLAAAQTAERRLNEMVAHYASLKSISK